MSATERKVVHEYLKDRDDVETYSEGTEPDRHLVVRAARLSRAFHVKHSGVEAVSRETSGRRQAPRPTRSRSPERSAPIARCGAARLQATDEHASTTVRDPAAAVDRHVADSLVGARAAVRSARRGGSPTSARARLARPGAGRRAAGGRVALVESAIRRCRYLERAVEAAGSRTSRWSTRARRSWRDGIGATTSSPPARWPRCPVLLEYAAPLLRRGRALVAWKGAVDRARRRPAARGRGDPRARGRRGPRGRAVSGRAATATLHVLPQGRAHAGALPAAPGNGAQAAARR